MSVADNSKFIALIPDNGSEFIAEQKAIFTVNPDIGFVKGKDSYISFEIQNTDSNNRINNFFQTAGASSIIQRMDIYSLANGQLLESLQNYNLWSSIENQYLYEDEKVAQVKEGTLYPLRAFGNTQAPDTKINTLVHAGNEIYTNGVGVCSLAMIAEGSGAFPASDLVTVTTDTDVEAGALKVMSRRYCIPLRSGIFSHFGVNEKLTPVLLLGGVKIELTFAKNERVLSRVINHRVAAGDPSGTTFKKMDAHARGIACDDIAGGATRRLTTTADLWGSIQETGLHRGAKIKVGGNARTVDAVIESIHRGNDGANPGTATNKICIVLTAVVANDTNVSIFFQDSSPSYKITNIELKLLQIVPPPQVLKGIIKESQFDFISWDCFLDNLPVSSLSHQSEITSVASKAKSVFTHYIDVANENNANNPTYYTGVPPQWSFLNSVQYFINNTLYPLRPYNPLPKADKVVNLNELVKAFATIGLVVKKLGDARGGNLANYTNTYLHARELARGENFVYNLKDAEPQIRLEFENTRDQTPEGGAAIQNVRMVNWVFSVKTIMVSKDNLQLLL